MLLYTSIIEVGLVYLDVNWLEVGSVYKIGWSCLILIILILFTIIFALSSKHIQSDKLEKPLLGQQPAPSPRRKIQV